MLLLLNVLKRTNFLNSDMTAVPWAENKLKSNSKTTTKEERIASKN
jgi:hypothetical protein